MRRAVALFVGIGSFTTASYQASRFHLLRGLKSRLLNTL